MTDYSHRHDQQCTPSIAPAPPPHPPGEAEDCNRKAEDCKPGAPPPGPPTYPRPDPCAPDPSKQGDAKCGCKCPPQPTSDSNCLETAIEDEAKTIAAAD